MKYFLYLLALPIMLFTSCGEESTPTQVNDEDAEIKWDIETIAEARQLMENKCYVCHSPKVKEELIIAPPMIAIKEAYMTSDEDAFIASMRRWLLHPSEDISKMPEAVAQFGIMPKQQYSERTIVLISKYLFREEIAIPDWWHDSAAKTEKTDDTVDLNKLTPLEKGAYYAAQTKQLLGQNLMGKIQKEGVENALIFCNENAISLTENKENEFNVSISRVSDKPRNKANQANEDETKLIAFYQSELAAGREPKGQIVRSPNGTNIFHAPIVTNDMCLKCHGTKTYIDKNVFDKINLLYPNDKAVGYSINEVRGIWRILLADE
jgi:hypothetical protein